MASRWRVKTGYAVAAILSGMMVECGVAQTSSEPARDTPVSTAQSAVPQSASAALREMTQLAGVIFTGQVVDVRRVAGVGGETGVVEISFAVEEAIRGVSGGIYTVREWAGLWPADDTPFLVGQRYLMLLHTPSAAGLSSPVGGMDGAIPIRGGRAAVAETATAGNSATVDGRVVDLRWVGTQVVQPVAYRSGTEAGVRAQLDSSVAKSAATRSALQAAAYSTVIGMLRGWEKANHAAQ